MNKTENLEVPALPFSGIKENKKRNGVKSNEIAPRKKILGERNGVSSCPNSPEKPAIPNPHEASCGSAGSDLTSNHQVRISPLNSSTASKILKSAPYDPTTNFLSPRPKFLRYNPNWRREILLSQEKIQDLSSDTEISGDTEQGESESSVSASLSSSSSSLEEDLVKVETCEDFVENDAVEIEQEDVEEEEEEVGSFKGLKWAFKLLLVLAVLFLSTAYISTMNSPTPPPAVQTLRGLKDECHRVGSELLEKLFEMQIIHRSKELGMRLSDHNALVVEDEDLDVEEEIAQQLGEVELVEGGSEGDSHGESEEIGKEMSCDVAVSVGNGGTLEMVNDSFDGLQIVEEVISDKREELYGSSTNDEAISSKGSIIDSFEEEKLTQKQEVSDSFDGLQIVEEVVVSDKREELYGSSTNDEAISRKGSFIDSFEEEKLTQKQEVSDQGVEQKKSEAFLNLKDKFLGDTTKDSIFIAVVSLLVAVGAFLALRFHLNCKKTTSRISSSQVAAEPARPKKAPCLPPTPPRPHENITPQVKLLGELDFGDDSSPVQNYNHRMRYQTAVSSSPSLNYSVGSEDLGMNSAASYGCFITEEKNTQKKEGKQVAAAADMGLSGTPVRRSVRIRNRKVTCT